MDHGRLTMDKIAARNRANATKSTGPKTPAGKRRSAQNARTHGLTAATYPTDTPVPDPAAQLEFTTALEELREEHRPATPTQHTLVHELALITWKLQYLPRVEHRLLNTPLPPDALQATPQPDPKNITPHPRLDHESDPTAAVLAAHFAADHPTPLTRLFAYHNRLQARMLSLLNQLRRLKRDQQRQGADDDGTTRARAYEQRTKPDHHALQEESRRIHQANQRRAAASPSEISNLKSDPPTTTCQTPPTCSNLHQTTPSTPPAQNEPTSSHSSPCLGASVPSVLSPAPAPPGATPRNTAQQNPPSAQDEPTPPLALISPPHIMP
jgi:hypothetical protein